MPLKTLDRNLHRLADLLGKTTLRRIFLTWFFIVIVFGFVYFGATFLDSRALLYRGEKIQHSLNGFFDAVYFSVITATTTGYGDIVPLGVTRIAAVMEVVLGFLIMSVLISKLVSVKQDIIIEELYRISFEDKINRLRSALYLFRSDCNSSSEKIIVGRFTKEDTKNVWVLLTSFDTLLADAINLMSRKNQYLQEIDSLRLELLLNSIDLSLNKLIILLSNLQTKLIKWKNEEVNDRIISIIKQLRVLVEYYEQRAVSVKTKEKLVATEDFITKLSTFK